MWSFSQKLSTQFKSFFIFYFGGENHILSVKILIFCFVDHEVFTSGDDVLCKYYSKKISQNGINQVLYRNTWRIFSSLLLSRFLPYHTYAVFMTSILYYCTSWKKMHVCLYFLKFKTHTYNNYNFKYFIYNPYFNGYNYLT